jgi:hypothetical protein
MVELTPGYAGLRVGGAMRGIYTDALHAREVDNQSTVADGIAADIVAATTNSQQNAICISEITVKSIRFVFLIVLALLTATYASAQNPVVQWNAIAATTIINNATEASVASGVWLGLCPPGCL